MVKNKGQSSIALKAEYVIWYLNPDGGKGTQARWAKEHDLAPETVSRWLHEDSEVARLIDEVEKRQPGRFATVIEAAYRVALNDEHPGQVTAMTFLAKVFGKFKSEKVDVTVVDRVSYVPAGALAELAARPN